MRALALTIAATAPLVLASCADIWGFSDGALAGDGGFEDGSSVASGASRRQEKDAGRGGSASRGDSARVTTSGAATTDAPATSAPPTTLDAGIDSTVPVADAWVGPPDSGTPCGPGCKLGAQCASAVGGASVCVQDIGECRDSKDCPSGCCAWLDSASAMGRCVATGDTTSVLCLCVPHGGKEPGTCETSCAPPSGATGPGINVCDAPVGPGKGGMGG